MQSKIFRAVSFLFMIIGTVLMSMIIWPYRTGELDIDFLLTKWKIVHFSYYQWSFYTHITTSLLVLVSCPILVSNWVLKKYRSVHKNIGKLYISLVLFLSAPSGLIMAFHANGGIASKVNFVLLSIAWWFTTFKGYKMIIVGDIVNHRIWMVRSIALSLSAVTLRFLQMTFYYIPFFNEADTYLLVSILSWAINVFIAEITIRKRKGIQTIAAI